MVTSYSPYELPVITPYRLDLTVSALRRLSMNVVDVLTPEGQYIHAFAGSHSPLIVRVEQVRPDALVVMIEGDVAAHAPALALVRLMLATERDVTDFERAAARIAWLAPLVRRMRGVRPPRYPALWDACVNAIVFQQVSLRAASTIMHRLICALGHAVVAAGLPMPLYLFPTATILRQIKGIGPWTAAVILLRGLGRLDVFPANDASVASNIALVSGSAALDVPALVAALGEQRGMLYFCLLLARLEARGEIGRPSFERPQADDARRQHG